MENLVREIYLRVGGDWQEGEKKGRNGGKAGGKDVNDVY